MNDKPEALVLALLRAIPEDVSEIKIDRCEVKGRLGILEETSLSRHVDRLGDQVERINKRP